MANRLNRMQTFQLTNWLMELDQDDLSRSGPELCKALRVVHGWAPSEEVMRDYRRWVWTARRKGSLPEVPSPDHAVRPAELAATLSAAVEQQELELDQSACGQATYRCETCEPPPPEQAPSEDVPTYERTATYEELMKLRMAVASLEGQVMGTIVRVDNHQCALGIMEKAWTEQRTRSRRISEKLVLVANLFQRAADDLRSIADDLNPARSV